MNTTSEKLFEYLCRTCMHELVEASSCDNKPDDQQWRSIFDSIEECDMLRLSELLSQAIPQIEVELTDEFPKKICCECLQQLLGVYRFQKMCKQSQKHMQELIAEKKSNVKLLIIDASEEVEGTNEKLCVEDNLSTSKDLDLLKHLPTAPTKGTNDPLESDETASCLEACDDGDNDVEYSNGDALLVPLPLQNDALTVTKKKRQQPALSSYDCEICSKSFNEKRLLYYHMRRHKAEEEKKLQKPEKVKNRKAKQKTEKPYQCKICEKFYKKPNLLRDHMRTHTDERPFLCPQCGKRFTASVNLQMHLGRHSDVKAYECPLCPKKFRCSSNLTSHKKTHNAVKSHICDICGYAFMQAGMLKKHKLNHSGEKKYKCEFCEMRFVRADQQRRHMRTHTGEKPYKCKYCECAYAQGNDLIKHLRIHLGDNVYRCVLCPLAFRLASELNLHITKHKNEDPETKERNMKALKEADAKLQIKLSETTCNLCNKSRSQ